MIIKYVTLKCKDKENEGMKTEEGNYWLLRVRSMKLPKSVFFIKKNSHGNDELYSFFEFTVLCKPFLQVSGKILYILGENA